MRFGPLTKSAAVAISLSCGWYQRCSSDEVKFIMQPKKQVDVANQPQVQHPTPTVDTSYELELSNSDEKSTNPISVELQPQATESTRGNGLKWVVRESLSTPRTVIDEVGPLSIANPNYREPQIGATSPGPPPVAQPSTQPSQATAETAASTQPETRVEFPQSRRAVLATLVSSQILASRPSNAEGGREVASIETPPGWQAVGQELSQRLARCESLINRKAYFSAREDAEGAMLYLMRVLDLMSNSYRSEPAWFAAQRALLEAEDFSTAQRLTSDSDFLRRIILSHETPVLKDADVASLAPMAAAQHYRHYAEDRLIEAAQGHPWASDVIYALGRTFQSQADSTPDGTELPLRWRAITLYRSARTINPGNAIAANQLGFILLQMDRPTEARGELIASLNAATSISALENMIEASRRLNDVAMAEWALQQHAALQGAMPNGPAVPQVLEVDVRTFAAISPYTIGPASPNVGNPNQASRVGSLTTAPANY